MSEQQATRELRYTFTGMAYDLHPELLKKAWRNGVMRVARRVKEDVLLRFAAKYPEHAQEARKAYGVMYLSRGGVSGFAITTYSHRPNAMSNINYYERWKDGKRKNGVKETVKGRQGPLIHWLEHGSFESGLRQTRFRIGRKRHNTGPLKALGLLAQEENLSYNQVEAEICEAIDKAAQKIVKKYES